MNSTTNPVVAAVADASGEMLALEPHPTPSRETAEIAGNEPVDVHNILRNAESQQQARAEQLPTEQDCIRMMVQCRLRLIDLGWREGEYAPRDGREFTAINAGFRGPVTCVHLGSGYFTADGGDWWPSPRPIVFRPLIARATGEQQS